MSERPTPETDAFIASQNHSPTTHQLRNFARIFERERDEAREEAERYRLDANAMMLQRDEAREELRAMARKALEGWQ